MSSEEAISNFRKRRGTARGSLTRLFDKVKDIEEDSGREDAAARAKLLLDSLDRVDADYRSVHFKLIDLIPEEDASTLGKEQDHIDKFDDDVALIRLRLQPLIAAAPKLDSTAARKTLLRKLSHLEKSLCATSDDLRSASDESDHSRIELHCEKLVDVKRTLAAIHDDFLAADLDDSDNLFIQHSKLESLQFDCAHKAKKLLGSSASNIPASTSFTGKGMKLPKLDVPTFNGDILNWSQFWEQFFVSVHDHSDLSDAEKLVYLQQAIKNSSAKNTIEGLSHTADNYNEAVSCLKMRYDRPRLIYRR